MPTSTWTATGICAEDGRFEEGEGRPFLMFEEEYDFVFWQPRTGELATEMGRSFALGEELIDNPGTTALDQWLNIFADPLQWLQHERNGIVVLNWGDAFERLRDVTRIAVAETILSTYQKHMKPKHMPRLAVLPKSETRAA